MRKWTDNLWLFTMDEFYQLPDGTVLTSVNGKNLVKGQDYIDMDIRFGHIAYGIKDPLNHPEAELFITFMLKF